MDLVPPLGNTLLFGASEVIPRNTPRESLALSQPRVALAKNELFLSVMSGSGLVPSLGNTFLFNASEVRPRNAPRENIAFSQPRVAFAMNELFRSVMSEVGPRT